MEFFLSIREPGKSLREVALPESGVVRIGRESPAEIVCADGFLSRVHAEIECKGVVFTVRDLDSRNGTLVNGVRVPESVLFHGDTVLAGRTCLRLAVKIKGKQVLGLLSEAPRLPVWRQTVVAKLRETCGGGDAAQGEEVVVAELGLVFRELHALHLVGDFVGGCSIC